MMRRQLNRSGFSLIELVVSMSLLGLAASVLVTAMNSLRELSASTDAARHLQLGGQKALDQIIEDLRKSGAVTSGVEEFPEITDEDLPGSTAVDVEALFGGRNLTAMPNKVTLSTLTSYFETHFDYSWEDPSYNPVRLGLEAAMSNREIRILRPADVDGDQRPDTDADGELVWDASRVSYVLVDDDGDGVGNLERRVGGRTRILCRDVERIVFDDSESSGFQIPLNAVRVQIWLRKVDLQGRLRRHYVQATVRLRNGDLN